MSPIIIEKRKDLLACREEILSALGLTPDEFHDLEETRTLTGEEFEAREELEEISFLLGEQYAAHIGRTDAGAAVWSFCYGASRGS